VRILMNPVAQFLLAGAVLLVVVALATGQLSSAAARDEAIADARATTELLARSVAEPAIPRGLVHGKAAAIDRFDRTARSRLLVGDVQRIKIWSAAGRIVYSDQTALIGESFPLGEAEMAVLGGGPTDAKVSDLDRPENDFEEGEREGGLLEVYTDITSPEGEPLLFEVYYAADEITARQREILGAFRPITLGGLLAFLGLTTPLIWVLTRRLHRAGEERARLLLAAVNASDAERRRIARDLHDGVVQDLAGTAFRLAAGARQDASHAPASAELEEMSRSLRGSLRSLRSLLVEIYPPDLRADGLPAALNDLVAPAENTGVNSSVTVADLDGVSEESVALVWRVAQEAVRNAVRHASPTAIEVSVARDDGSVVLEVHDDGVGFDPTSTNGRDRLGLRGLADLIDDAGGRLEVWAEPGSGTRVRLEVVDR
jgi:two-component system NarL family sensor kinase